MFKHSVVIGKFYPPHRGHSYLIDTAVKRSEKVTVIVCWKEGQEIPGPLRAQWIQRMHPTVDVKLLENEWLPEWDSEAWAKATISILGFVPDAVFTSEAYGDPYAHFMGSVHVLVDMERTTIPVSGTKVRDNPMEYRMYLAPPVRAYFVKRVVIVGAESTGKTTLAEDLAAHFKTVWVPEYGRMYAEGKLTMGDAIEWRSTEFTDIARAQALLADSLAESANGILIADTDAFATSIWHERYMGTRSEAVEQIAKEHIPDLYLLASNDIPFAQDGTRDGEHIRDEMQERFVERLTELSVPFVTVGGTRKERLRDAISAITNHLHITHEDVHRTGSATEGGDVPISWGHYRHGGERELAGRSNGSTS